MRRLIAVALAVAGCSQPADRDGPGGEALERAAIATGVIRDPASSEIAGLYARDTDRVCVVAAAGGGYRIGTSVDYGSQRCSARGTLTRSGERLRVAFEGAADCSFDARIEQNRIVFPGELPAGCERLCTGRASLAALEADLLSDAASEAAGLRDADGRLLCAS